MTGSVTLNGDGWVTTNCEWRGVRMDAAKKILEIISPWAATGKMIRSAEVGFLERHDVVKLREYAYKAVRFPAYYERICAENNYHQALRMVLKVPGYLDVLVKSGNDWKTLDRVLSQAVGTMLHQSNICLSGSRDVLDVVENMDLMEQLDCTISELTEEKLNELRSRALSQRDSKTVGSLQNILEKVLAVARVNKTLVMGMNVEAGKFNHEFRTSALPVMERLYTVTSAGLCRTDSCFRTLLATQAALNTMLNYRRVDVSAAALNDLQVALSTYLESTIRELTGMHDNLAVLFFVVQFKGVVDVWQTVDSMLKNTKKALE